MNRKRIITTNTIWEFDLDRMVYIRLPKNESSIHPEWLAKPYEGREVAFHDLKLGRYDEKDGTQEFFVFNTGVKWGEGACTTSWAVPNQDLAWVEALNIKEQT
jgi:hypothetical protein